MDEAPTPEQTSMIGRQWRLIAIVLVGVVVALSLWYFLVLRQDYAVLYGDLRPAQAAAVVAALEDEGSPYRIGEGGAAILTPARDADALRLRLASSGAELGGLDGFELFNESDMGLTDFAQKIRYQRALQGELARTIMTMQGVAEARVHVSMPERTVFRGERRNAEAAVSLVMQPDQDATPQTIEGVQRLVASAVTDLSPTDVVVLNARGAVISARIVVAASGDSEAYPAPSADYVNEVIRVAIPDRRFDVRIEEIPSPLAGAGEDPTLVDHTPRRLVTITTESLLAAEEQERVRAEFERAGLIDGSSRQLLSFRVDRVQNQLDAATAVSARSESPPALNAREPSTLLIWPLALAALVMGAGIAALLWRRARRPTLSFEDHKLVAQRLRAELSAEAPDV